MDDFNLIDAFGILDDSGKGYITATELRAGLLQLGTRLSMDEIELIFQRLNKDACGLLKYSEFSEEFLPEDPHYARMLGRKRMNYMNNGISFCERTL